MLILEDILSQEIIQRLGWTLLHFIWQAAVVALLLAIMLRLLRKSAANVRYIIACLAFTLIVLLPVITIQLVPVSVQQMACTRNSGTLNLAAISANLSSRTPTKARKLSR